MINLDENTQYKIRSHQAYIDRKLMFYIGSLMPEGLSHDNRAEIEGISDSVVCIVHNVTRPLIDRIELLEERIRELEREVQS